MVTVAYRRLSFTRGSNCKALPGKVLVFWIGGRLWDVVACEGWSHREVRLYILIRIERTSLSKEFFHFKFTKKFKEVRLK